MGQTKTTRAPQVLVLSISQGQPFGVAVLDPQPLCWLLPGPHSSETRWGRRSPGWSRRWRGSATSAAPACRGSCCRSELAGPGLPKCTPRGTDSFLRRLGHLGLLKGLQNQEVQKPLSYLAYPKQHEIVVGRYLKETPKKGQRTGRSFKQKWQKKNLMASTWLLSSSVLMSTASAGKMPLVTSK